MNYKHNRSFYFRDLHTEKAAIYVVGWGGKFRYHRNITPASLHRLETTLRKYTIYPVIAPSVLGGFFAGFWVTND